MALPFMRIFGSFLVTILTQFIMQHRILTILRRKLISKAILRNLKESPDGLKPGGVGYESLGLEGATDRTLWKLLNWESRVDDNQVINDGQSNNDSQNNEQSPIAQWLDRRYATELAKHIDAAEEVSWKVLFIFHSLLLVGMGLIITGYVGCFSIVQGSS